MPFRNKLKSNSLVVRNAGKTNWNASSKQPPCVLKNLKVTIESSEGNSKQPPAIQKETENNHMVFR